MALTQAEAMARGRISQEPTTDLLREAVDEARTLVRLEVALARDELRSELKAAKGAAIAGGVAIVAAVLSLATLIALVVVALGPIGGLILFGALVAVAAIAGLTAYRLAPKKPLEATRKRLEGDVDKLKEHMA